MRALEGVREAWIGFWCVEGERVDGQEGEYHSPVGSLLDGSRRRRGWIYSV